jgi:hypothetical protein
VNVRRVLVAASAVGALLASTPATAVGTYTLDGHRTTSKTWSGVLDAPSVPVTGATRLATDPVLEDCTAQSCSVRNLRLTLPKGRTKGEFVVSGVFDASMAGALVLYNAKGEYVRSADLVGCCGQFDVEQSTYGLNFKIKMLNAGRYTFAVVNRGGTGTFKATITWTALPPERRKPS